MSVELNATYDRERLALYIAGLLPDDTTEAVEVLKLTKRLLPVLKTSREAHQEDRRAG